jgi:hypothetical protein
MPPLTPFSTPPPCFKDQEEAASPGRLQAILDATEELRSKSLVDASILTAARGGTANKQPNSKLFGKYQELVNLVQVCETARDTRTTGVAKLSDG